VNPISGGGACPQAPLAAPLVNIFMLTSPVLHGAAAALCLSSVRLCVRAALDLRHSPIRLGVHYYTVGRKKEPLFFHD